MERATLIGETSVGGSELRALNLLAAAKASCSEAAPRICSTSASHSSSYDSAGDGVKPPKSSCAALCGDVGKIGIQREYVVSDIVTLHGTRGRSVVWGRRVGMLREAILTPSLASIDNVRVF